MPLTWTNGKISFLKLSFNNILYFFKMKKLFIVMLGASAVVACTKSSVSYEPTREIALAPVNEINKTKTTVTDGVFPDDRIMGVYAYYKADCLDGTDVKLFKDASTYLDNVQFKKNGTNWAGWKDGAAYPYYWPKNGSLVFAAYSPLTDADAKPAVSSHTFKADGTAVVSDIFKNETFTQSRLTDKTVDLMWSPVTASSHTSKSNKVAMTFYHAMSWITFKAKFTKPANMATTTEPVITIKSLTLDNVATKGKFETHVAEINWTPIVDNAIQLQPIVVFRGEQALTATSANVENNANGTLVIPQEITNDIVATITYDQHVPGTAKVEQKAVLHLNQCKVGEQSLTTWMNAKHYIYDINFTFGTDDQIYIAPSVQPWKEENVTTEGGAIEHK